MSITTHKQPSPMTPDMLGQRLMKALDPNGTGVTQEAIDTYVRNSQIRKNIGRFDDSHDGILNVAEGINMVETTGGTKVGAGGNPISGKGEGTVYHPIYDKNDPLSKTDHRYLHTFDEVNQALGQWADGKHNVNIEQVRALDAMFKDMLKKGVIKPGVTLAPGASLLSLYSDAQAAPVQGHATAPNPHAVAWDGRGDEKLAKIQAIAEEAFGIATDRGGADDHKVDGRNGAKTHRAIETLEDRYDLKHDGNLSALLDKLVHDPAVMAALGKVTMQNGEQIANVALTGQNVGSHQHKHTTQTGRQ